MLTRSNAPATSCALLGGRVAALVAEHRLGEAADGAPGAAEHAADDSAPAARKQLRGDRGGDERGGRREGEGQASGHCDVLLSNSWG